jgi:glycosyltransferase involved in cell wall biosynthesis
VTSRTAEPAGLPPRRYKVLYLIPNLQQGGAERQLLELIRRLPERFEPALCVFDGEVHYADYLAPGEPRYVLGTRRRMTRAGYRRLVEILRDARPDILHTWRDPANFWGRLAVKHAPPPVVVSSVRNRALNPLNLATERRFSGRTDRVLANSEGVRRELVSIARVPSDKVQIIHNFIDVDRFRPPTPAERAEARRRFQLADGDIAVLLSGRISIQKNQLVLGLALGKMRRRGALPPSVRVLLAGRNHDRLYAAALGPWLALQGVKGQVTRLGTVTDMLSLYQASDVAVMPSLYEGLPNAVLEALACGLPAVVSGPANIDGLVTEAAGFQVPPLGASALADALARIIALPDEERRRMGAAGRQHIVERFSAARVLGEVVALYDRLLAVKGLGGEMTSHTESNSQRGSNVG